MRLRQQFREQRVQRGILRAANIQRERNLTGDHAAQFPDRRHAITSPLSGGVFDQHHPLGGGGKGILTVIHRHGTRVSGFPGEAAAEAARAVDGFHHAQRQTFLLQTRPLFDMQFQTGAEIVLMACRQRHAGGIEPRLHHRLRHADATGITRLQPALRPGAGDAPAA